MEKVFISYSWDNETHKEWVKQLRDRLEGNGVHTILDRVDLKLGDSIPKFMEESIRKSDCVLLILTPSYKEKADERIGGVGYEDAIITGEILSGQTKKRFIPVLAEGSWDTSLPYWAIGRCGVDLTGRPYDEQEFTRLLSALREKNNAEPLYSLSGKQFNILNLFAEDGHFTSSQIAERTNYTVSSINYQIKGLVEQGILRKQDSKYSLTELGQAWLAA